MMALDTVVVRNSDVLGSDVGDDTVLMGIEQGSYYTLTATSRVIWERLKAPVRVRDLCAELAEAYRMPLETVEVDTIEFLDYLETQRLIERKPAPGAAADGPGD